MFVRSGVDFVAGHTFSKDAFDSSPDLGDPVSLLQIRYCVVDSSVKGPSVTIQYYQSREMTLFGQQDRKFAVV